MANPMTLTENTEMIETLRAKAASAGEERMVRMCDRVLHHGVELVDSDTNAQLTAEDLGIDAVSYVELCCESLDIQQAEGHVRVRDRRVFAS